METQEQIQHLKKIIEANYYTSAGILAEGLEFLRIHAGGKSAFFTQLSNIRKDWTDDYTSRFVKDTLEAYINFIEKGLSNGISLERKVQLDVVSDILDQARILLETTGVHPAAPCVLIGASLEEFLRNWVEEIGVKLDGKPTIDTYAKNLKGKELLTKQDMKDIASWSGLRNHAAHGEWDQVKDKNRISLMLEGVNLFMRRYNNN